MQSINSQYLANPHSEHLKDVHHLLKYLKGTTEQGILLHVFNNFHIKAFFGSDWGACLDTRRSITGFCIFLGDSLISWETKKQPKVSPSSAEAEYRAIVHISIKITWVFSLLQAYQISSPSPALVFCDNLVAISIATHPTFHEITKHIEISATSSVIRLMM